MLSRREEDYLLAILNLKEQKNLVRITHLAQNLKVTPPSVCEMLRKLDSKKLIIYRKNQPITLTPRGEEIASALRDRHTAILNFLKLLDVPAEVAEKDACILEHQLHPKTLLKLKKFTNKNCRE